MDSNHDSERSLFSVSYRFCLAQNIQNSRIIGLFVRFLYDEIPVDDLYETALGRMTLPGALTRQSHPPWRREVVSGREERIA